ncbi:MULTISPECIES: hypothetical protein [Actinomyces]|uniref:hypothetical protein n=1 Tax=Actinomyces TaxID=1654 RepID=UPI001FAA74B8|nr:MULTISPECIES: hypothetical protein [Actinomyces]
MEERPRVRTVRDTRRPAYGWGRILVVVFAAFGAAILGPALLALVRRPDEAPLLESFNALGGLLYLLLSVSVAHNGRRMRNVGWMSLAALATMEILIGALSLSPTYTGLDVLVWSDGGRSLGYLPLLLPVVAAVWMWMSDPRRIVVNAERMTELSDTLTERSRAVYEAHREAGGVPAAEPSSGVSPGDQEEGGQQA